MLRAETASTDPSRIVGLDTISKLNGWTATRLASAGLRRAAPRGVCHLSIAGPVHRVAIRPRTPRLALWPPSAYGVKNRQMSL